MIYNWYNMSLKYAQYEGTTAEYEAAISWNIAAIGTPLPPLSEWKIPTLTQYIGNGDKKSSRIIADCVSSAAINLISQKAADSLKEFWDRHATLYPVILDDKPNEYYYMVVVHTVIDCLDREQSVGTKALEGTERENKGYFDIIIEWIMREEEIGDNDLFVLPDDLSNIYTSEKFKQKVIAAGVTGFGFCETQYFGEEHFIS